MDESRIDPAVDRPRTKAILKRIPTGGSLLDIGCAQHDAKERSNPNWLHGHLYDLADDVLGVDYLESDVERLQEAGYNVVAQNAEQLDFDETFDTVVAGELIEHLSNPGQFLDSVYDHLKSDGQLVLSTPNPWSLHRFYQTFSGEVYCNPEHACWFDERTLRQLLHRHNFEVNSVDYVEPPAWGIRKALYRTGVKLLAGGVFIMIATPTA